MNVFDAACTLTGGVFVCMHILMYVLRHFPAKLSAGEAVDTRRRPGIFFTCAFLSICFIYLVYLFFVVYPGSVSGDSIWQITQIANGRYRNNHPFWHTMIIKVFLELGYAVFGEANAAVATYSAGQIVIMAACFSYALLTLYQIGIPKIWIALSFAMYAFLPHNITYSATMWKDVLFSGAMLLMVAAAFRIMKSVGKRKCLDYILFFIGGIGSCTLRTNGWASMLAAGLIMIPILWKKSKKLVGAFAAVLIVGGLMAGPVLALLNVGETDMFEALSVPVQQISRVITNGGELTEEETELLEMVVDLEEIPQLYTEWVSDPIKGEIKSKNRTYLEENFGEYVKLWFKLGLRYPGEYLEAWIEQTKGYWNGGYDYYIYAEYVKENSFGITMPHQTNIIYKLVKAYFTFSREAVFFEPIQSIGLHVWLMVLLCFLNVVNKREEAVLFIPCFIIVLGLCLGSPVYSQFRYAYPIFTVYPLMLPATLHHYTTGFDRKAVLDK